MTQQIYLDNSATTRPYDDVIEYMDEVNRKMYGNPSSLHLKGIEAERHLKKAREAIADTLKVDGKQIVFTSGGTEANNLAIKGYLEANARKGNHIITTAVEHPSVLEIYRYLQKKGYDVDYIGVNEEGAVDLEELERTITKQTTLISILHTNNETGAFAPIEQIGKIKNIQNPQATLHVDAVQAYGKQVILPSKMGIDMMSMSSHKIHGSKGVGALYIGQGIKVEPILHGGGQESLMRSGTENVPGICGFGRAAQMAFGQIEENKAKVGALKELFIEELEQKVEAFKVLSPRQSSPYILSVSFPHVRAEVLLHHLEAKNIFVSTGAACSSRKNMHSHVLTAMKLQVCDIEGTIRFSFSAFNTKEEIQQTVEELAKILPKIQIKRGGRR